MEDIAVQMDEQLAHARGVLDALGSRGMRSLLKMGKNLSWVGEKQTLERTEFYLFRVNEVTFEEKAPRREAMENILGTLRGMDGISFLYILLGDSADVKFYFGVARDKSYPEEKLPFSVKDLGRDILAPSMKGNFRGSKIEPIEPTEQESILKRLKDAPSVGMLEGVPGVDEENEDFQGTDRLIDVMLGDEFGFVVVAAPHTDDEVDFLEKQLYALSDALSPLAQYSIERTKNQSTSQSESTNLTKMEQAASSTQDTETKSRSENEGSSRDTHHDDGNQVQSSSNHSANKQYSLLRNHSLSDATSSGAQRKENSAGNSSSEGFSKQNQSSYSYHITATQGASTSTSHNETQSYSFGTMKSKSESFAENTTHAAAETKGDSAAVNEQAAVANKAAVGWLEYIDKVLLPRLDCGRGKGIFSCCTYLFAKKRSTLYRLANTAISLYSTSKGNKAALFFHDLTEQKSAKGCLHALQNLQIPAAVRDDDAAYLPALGLSRWEKPHFSYCGSWFSANELALLAGLPQKEVIGLRLREEVEFGLNVEPVPKEAAIPLGHLVQSGEEKRHIPVCLKKRDLDKHTFIAGVTGSGKTTTCQNILRDCKLPFLVIEPAKTEYRSMIGDCPDLLFFTPGLPDVAPFFLNPFELFPGEKITSRADMLKATFEASFAMEAAIPQIMEAAIYRAYEDKGWDIETNLWYGAEGKNAAQDPFAAGVCAFPTLSDFVVAIKEVTEKQGFDERLKNDYIGSLNARIESLLVGAKGQMLNTPRSIDFASLVHRKVVIELEEIRSGAEKSLLMGFILTNLLQAVRHAHEAADGFQHITLVEEAHRLLSRYMPGDSMNKKQGVEVFSDMLAEVRKYGESLIIVDQIPDKMTPEVLKNTNTKIVHKLFAQDDKDAIGNTMALSDEQKAFLSNLPPGRAIMFSQGWTKAIQMQVEEKVPPKERGSIADIRQAALNYYAEEENVRRGILRGMERLPKIDARSVADYLSLLQGGAKWLKIYHEYLKNGSAGREEKAADRERFQRFAQGLRQAVERCGEDMVLTYLYWNTYTEEDAEREIALREVMREIVKDAQAKMICLTKRMVMLSYT